MVKLGTINIPINNYKLFILIDQFVIQLKPVQPDKKWFIQFHHFYVLTDECMYTYFQFSMFSGKIFVIDKINNRLICF